MQLSIPDDQYFMQQALVQARMAFEADEVPVGAVVVLQNRIIARGHNQVEQLTDATAHAEMLAITSAFNALGAKYLPDATLYVTLEPCLMCCGALFWGKIGRVVFGAADPKNGFKSKTAPHWPLHPKTELVGGVLEAECGALMTAFFRNKR
jgi:tRNA(adenine34) deaminase